nr:hypothetical protein [Tanacetum cinerariifolium]GFA94928.1 hypothetical protein [Tanacetum cinerariifolium]
MYHPERASPPQNQSSPIKVFNFNDDNLEPLWVFASQPSQYMKGPSEPVEYDFPVEKVAPVKPKRKYTRRRQPLKKSDKYGMNLPLRILRIKERELELEDQKRREQGELERLKIEKWDKELDLQQKMFEFQQQQKWEEDIKYYNEDHEHLTGRALSTTLLLKKKSKSVRI